MTAKLVTAAEARQLREDAESHAHAEDCAAMGSGCGCGEGARQWTAERALHAAASALAATVEALSAERAALRAERDRLARVGCDGLERPMTLTILDDAIATLVRDALIGSRDSFSSSANVQLRARVADLAAEAILGAMKQEMAALAASPAFREVLRRALEEGLQAGVRAGAEEAGRKAGKAAAPLFARRTA